MKKLFLSLTITLCALCHSQTVIDLNFDPKTQKVTEKTKKISFSSGKEYIVHLHGLNSAYIDPKITSASKILSSATPTLLTTLLPGINESSVFNLSGEKKSLVENDSLVFDIYADAVYRYNRLRQLKSEADTLYETTKYRSNSTLAKLKYDKIAELFIDDSDVITEIRRSRPTDVHSNLIKRKINLDIQFIQGARDYYKALVQDSGGSVSTELVNIYSELSYISTAIGSIEYLKYFSSIDKSLTSTDIIKSKPFKAEKDVVDLQMILIDNYKNDTIFKDKVEFFTKNNFAFHFSSGFFYNDIAEKYYYIKNRNEVLNNVVEENDNRDYDVSIGAMAHLSYKITNWLKAGISTGVSLSVFDGKMRYMVGPSFMFGREKLVGLNFGWAFAKIKALSAAVEKDDVGYHVPIAVTSVPTYEKITSGIYFGLTYNLFSTRK